MHQHEKLKENKIGHGKGHFSSTPHMWVCACVCVCVCVCVWLHLLGLNLLALQHVCRLSKQADRQRGQTGCYKTSTVWEKKKNTHTHTHNPGEERVKSYARSTGMSYTRHMYISAQYVCAGSLHFPRFFVFFSSSPVLQIFELQSSRRERKMWWYFLQCVCVCVSVSMCVLLTHWT